MRSCRLAGGIGRDAVCLLWRQYLRSLVVLESECAAWATNPFRHDSPFPPHLACSAQSKCPESITSMDFWKSPLYLAGRRSSTCVRTRVGPQRLRRRLLLPARSSAAGPAVGATATHRLACICPTACVTRRARSAAARLAGPFATAACTWLPLRALAWKGKGCRCVCQRPCAPVVYHGLSSEAPSSLPTGAVRTSHVCSICSQP